MPDRFPTVEDVPLPNVGGARPVAGYDVSPLARGGQALAQGVSNLGQGIEKSAQTVEEYELAKRRNDALLAQDQVIGDVYKAREEFKHDTGYDDLTDRWDKRVDGIVTKGVQNIPEGPTRDHVMARLQIPLARTRDAVEDYAFNGRSQQAHANLYDRANTLLERTGPDDDPLVTADVDGFNSRVDEYAQQKLITPLQAQQYKQKLALDRADARARARIDQAVAQNNPGEIVKVLGELRNSIPRGGSSLYPPGGWGPTDHAAAVVSGAETGDRTIGVKALGNISPDSNGSKSYGFLGLNSGTGSASAFVQMYGRSLGLTARPGSAAFDAQWKDAAANNTPALRQAQLHWFNEQVLPSISSDLQRHGVPANVASDPRVVTYFADRSVQMGGVGKGNIDAAWNGAGGDPVRFMRNMNAIDGTPAEYERNFKSAIASGVYSPEGHANRLQQRLEGALATGTGGRPPGGANFMRGPLPGAGDLTTVDTAAGQIRVHKAAATDIKGFVDDLAAAGAPAEAIGGHDQRRIAGTDTWSPHAYGTAIDYGQTARNVVDPKFKAWASANPDKLRQIAARHNMISGGDWSDPDFGHFEWAGPRGGAAGAPDHEAPAGYTGDPLFAKLTPEKRDSLIAHAQSALNHGRTNAEQLLKAGVNDDYAAARTAGYVGNARTLDDFNTVYGDDAGPAMFQNYNRGLQLNRDLYAMQGMPPEERNQILAYHESNLHPGAPGYAERYKEFRPLLELSNKLAETEQTAVVKEKQGEIKDLVTRADDTVQEMLHTGKIGKAITRDEFIATLGEQDGEAYWNRYTGAVQYATDTFHLPEQSPEEKIGVESLYQPKPGQDNQEKAWARYGELRHAADTLHAELTKDPAGYMLRYNPAVRDAWTKMQGAPADQEAQASQSYADMMMAEQKRFGVEPQDIKVVPDQYADSFKSKVLQLAQAGNGNQIAPMIDAERKRWGPAWDHVYRQVTAGDPMLRIVGAGVKSLAAQLLTEDPKRKFGDIVKDEQSAKARDIRESVEKELDLFRTSTDGMIGGEHLYGDVRGQVEKLAAIYAFENGKDAAAAAKQAADDVINFKYDYRDSYRIPNDGSVEAEPRRIQMGAAIARNYLGENAGGVDLQLKPFVDTYGGAYTAAQLASETADAKRSGHWATNNDESGLWYVYNNQVARRPDGAPLQLTWKELAGLADSGRAPAARPGRLPPIDWAKVREQIERERRTQPTTSELWGLGGGGTR